MWFDATGPRYFIDYSHQQRFFLLVSFKILSFSSVGQKNNNPDSRAVHEAGGTFASQVNPYVREYDALRPWIIVDVDARVFVSIAAIISLGKSTEGWCIYREKSERESEEKATRKTMTTGTTLLGECAVWWMKIAKGTERDLMGCCEIHRGNATGSLRWRLDDRDQNPTERVSLSLSLSLSNLTVWNRIPPCSTLLFSSNEHPAHSRSTRSLRGYKQQLI